jgi:hypothetical protein
MAGVAATAWMVQQPYEGLYHDSRLYTLQALARIHPELLANDLFLRFGSQDSFSIFGPIYAASVNAFGLESAAAMLTFVSHAAFFVAAWLLARALMSSRLAWLAVGLIAALPGNYGGGGVFQYIESFITPRMAAEAFTLAALAALLYRHYAIAGFCVFVGTLLHPLMAAAGLAAGALLVAPMLRIRAVWVVAALVIAPLLLAMFAHVGPDARLDVEWRSFLESQSPYLFLAGWRAQDWLSTSVSVATLLVAALLPLPERAKEVAQTALVTGLAGCLVAVIGSDVLGLALITQTQPWRWLWLGTAISVLLIPAIGVTCWQLGSAGRSVALLLLAAWVCQNEPHSWVPAVLAVALALVIRHAPTRIEQRQRLVLLGSALFALASLAIALSNNLIIAQSTPDQSHSPWLMRAVRTMTRDGVVMCIAVALCWWGITRLRGRISLLATAAVLGTVFVASVRASITEWTPRDNRATFEALAPWRRLIPAGEEVLWLDNPLGCWTLLERPSYLSAAQVAAALFSREAATELKTRAGALASYTRNEGFVPFLEAPGTAESAAGTAVTLADTCARANVKFIVTRHNLHATALASAPDAVSNAYRSLQLYGCPAGHEK